MSDGMNAVLAALDAAPGPVHFFVRDDDAGWEDARLIALLDCMERVRVPIDLAVIPEAANDSLARELRARIDVAAAFLGVHQHGYKHCNHEPEGRRCEFGGARNECQQRYDLKQGRVRLQALFGGRLDAIFTPPWNRCSPSTPAVLAALGFTALSRDRGAAPQSALPELPVDVDWCKRRRAALAVGDSTGEAIATDIARRIQCTTTVGLMLHHAEMDAPDLALLEGWLAVWARHPRARWLPMRRLLSRQAVATTETPSGA